MTPTTNTKTRNYAAAFAAALAIGGLSAAAVVQAQDGFTKNPAEVRAGSYVLDPGHSKISWAVNHLGFSTYTGQFAKAEGRLTVDPKNPERSALVATVKTDDVGTLNPDLDKHLKTPDFLDTAKFPTATFRSTSLKLTGKTTADVTGDLTLHGVTRPVTFKATFNQAGVNPLDKTYSVGFDGELVIKRSEFGITTYVPAVGDEVKLTLEAEFKAAS